jgi:hypothetical protein
MCCIHTWCIIPSWFNSATAMRCTKCVGREGGGCFSRGLLPIFKAKTDYQHVVAANWWGGGGGGGSKTPCPLLWYGPRSSGMGCSPFPGVSSGGRISCKGVIVQVNKAELILYPVSPSKVCMIPWNSVVSIGVIQPLPNIFTFELSLHSTGIPMFLSVLLIRWLR